MTLGASPEEKVQAIEWQGALLHELKYHNNTLLAVVNELKYLRKEVECLRLTVKNKP